MDLRDSAFVVTGGASGLGAAHRAMLVAGGGRAVIADLKEDDGRALAQSLGDAASSSAPTSCDEASAAAR
jgi:NAD(P)-dependent dehydrogenase (short-subunit alcohol dehydrogenase family)